MQVTKWLERLLIDREYTPRTEENYRGAVRAFNAWLGRDGTLDELVDRVSEFIRDRSRVGSPYTTNSKRLALQAIISGAVESGLVKRPDKIRRVKCPDIVPSHISPAEYRSLIAATYQGQYGAMIRAGVFVAADTGLRFSNVIDLRWQDVDDNGVVRVVQKKSRRTIIALLRRETIEACRTLLIPGDDRLVPFAFGRSAWNKWFRLLKKAAKIYRPRLAMQAIRRTAADAVARERGVAAAAQFLGHSPKSGEAVARKFYLSAEACGHQPILPPRLG